MELHYFIECLDNFLEIDCSSLSVEFIFAELKGVSPLDCLPHIDRVELGCSLETLGVRSEIAPVPDAGFYGVHNETLHSTIPVA